MEVNALHAESGDQLVAAAVMPVDRLQQLFLAALAFAVLLVDPRVELG